jgi:hypothetical protein
MSRHALGLGLLGALVLVACGDDGGPSAPPDVYFDLGSAADQTETFWDLPFPSDLRMTGDGFLDLAGYPNRRDAPLLEALLVAAREHRGAPMMPITYVRFGVAVPPRVHTDVIPPGADQDVFLVDIDPDSPARGTMVALVAETLILDDFAPPTLVSVAPRPGIVLAPATTYAVVFRRSFAPDAEPPPDFAALREGTLDAGRGGRAADAAAVYAPLWPTLAELGVDDALVATVFTTGDETRVMYERSEAVRAAHDAVISPLAIDPTDGAAHDGFCELTGTVTFPQFQVGTAPYSHDGNMVLDDTGAPVMQNEITVPLAITIPFGEMPAAGWPLYQYFHGSGGRSSDLVDRGKTLTPTGLPTVGEGQGFIVAKVGIAAASSALPINPERLPGATDYEYLNINNLAAFPYTFQEGVYEQRLLLDALLELRIPASALAGCAQVTLPSGVTEHRFDATQLTAGGQSMGGMYTNLIASIDPRFGALVPTGAGGMWNLMILETTLIPGAKDLIVAAFATDFDHINFMHPALNAMAMGWEIAEPIVAMSRLSRQPLDEPGFAPRSVYEPVGKDDHDFPPPVYDAAALAYGNQQAGDELWPEMQDTLALDGRDGIAPYPVSVNTPEGTTGVVVQYAGDGIIDPHNIAYQLDEVKHQYACFLATYLATGTAVVVAPGAIDDPCP